MNTEMIKCETCETLFNPGYLDQVAEHMHDGVEIKELIKGKRVIEHARDIYPHCSGEFSSGVHLYLKGYSIPKRPCDDQLIQGWLCAKKDLKNNYTIKF